MRYRAEVDGLRAIAVVPVILFHAGFELFRGGFVGVDVFFVISGYLITTILIQDLESDRFSIAKFYERRARRILPALFFVMLVCLPFAWVWMRPNILAGFAQSLLAVSLFASNILFWQESDYFDAAAEEKPLLHTWSLAVEEQFYILFPILLVLTWRFGKNYVFWMIVVFAAGSLALSEWGWRYEPTANFYLTPTRAWELFAGSIAAFQVQKKGVHSNNFFSLAGLAAIVFAIFTYDQTTPFPSAFALVPVIGVVSIVLFADKDTLVAKLLSTKLFAGVGLISYSAYLWHQPLFAFARIKLIDEPSTVVMGILSVTSFVLAVFSWKYIEMPFRKVGDHPSKTWFVLSSSIAGLMAFSALGYFGYKSEGFPNRFEVPTQVYKSVKRSERQGECFGKSHIHKRKDWYCGIGLGPDQSDILVFGDSHALSFLPAIDEAARQSNLGGIFVGAPACAPLLTIHALRPDQSVNNCHLLNKRVFDYVRNGGVSTVILVARWSYYTDGGYNGDDFSYIALSKQEGKTQAVSRAAFEQGLADTINAYQNIGVRLVIVAQAPEQKIHPLDLYISSLQTDSSLHAVSVSLDEHLALQKYVNGLFSASGAEILDFTDLLCSGGRCAVGNDNVSFYYDDDHLSVSGSLLLVKKTIRFLQRDE